MIHHNELINGIYCIEEEFSMLTSMAESVVAWNSIPASKNLILKERLDALKFIVKDIFDILDGHLK